MEMTLEVGNRKVVETIVKDLTPGKIISSTVYDDGTEITFHQTADTVNVSSNKKLEIQADGKTIKIID